jgi:hypothetical protein
MFDAALPRFGFMPVGTKVRSNEDRTRMETGHDLDRVFVRDGVACDSGKSVLETTKPADLKSAGQAAVQVLYKRSPECSKTPQNALLQSVSHNNIRKTGPIRNRQVCGSSPLVGSITYADLRSVHCDLLHNCCTSILASN